jgi:uncharacterized protein (TIGR03437 family)
VLTTSYPANLLFVAQTGQPAPAGQSLYFNGSDNSLYPLNISATTSTPWITIAATTNSSVYVTVSQASLSTGTYTGSVVVTQSGATNSPVTVPVVIVVNGGGSNNGGGALIFTPSSLTFTTPTGATPAAQTLAVTSSSGSASFSTSINYSTGANWLTVTPSSASTAANLSVSVNTTNLAAGTYNATINFSAGGTSTQSVPVTLTITASATGNVTVAPTTLSFSAQTGATPASQTIAVSSASGSAGVSFTIAPTTTSGGSWLSVSPTGTQVANGQNITVIVNSANLAAGTYSGNLAIQPNGGNVVNVPVTLTVSAPATVSATPTALTFNYQTGGSNPAAQTITVSGGSSSLPFSATATSTGNWLLVSPATGTTPGTVSVTVNPSSLNTGSFTGTVTIAGTGSATGTTTVNVTLNITAPLPTLSSVTNAASYATGAVSPGEIITLFATDATHPIGPATPAYLTLDPTGKFVTTSLGNVQVTVGGYAAPLTYVSASQISAIVPYEVAQLTSATVIVKFLGQSSNGITVPVATTAPGLFTANSSGTGPGAILNSDSTLNTQANPAARGSVVVLYLTGEGQTSPAGVDGKVTTVATPPAPLTPAPLLPIAINIGGQAANWTFAGEAPGLVSGVMQLNVVVPTNISPGSQIPVQVTIGSNLSQTGVYLAVK